MSNKLFIYAPNIHQGGGAVLLQELLDAAPAENLILYVDSRMKIPDSLNKKLQIYRVKPTIWQRLKAELQLRKLSSANDNIICFNNLPPLFKNSATVVVFLQNRYLVDLRYQQGLSFYLRLRIFLERLQLEIKYNNAASFVVQTQSMARLLKSRLSAIRNVKVIPFYKPMSHELNPGSSRYDFIYVASGEPHKNHRRLIEAWCLLAEQGVYPSLCLTLNAVREKDLYQWILQKKQTYQLKLELINDVPWAEMQNLYGQAKALIYPSLRESFGLPLLEAQQAGLAIIAAELDYVRDLLDPSISFDPQSAVSIARAVKRFLKVPENRPEVVDAKGFLQELYKAN